MVLFKEQDMLKYMSDLGQTVTTVEIERDYELPFIEDLKSEIRNSNVKSLLSRYAPLVTLMKRSDKIQESVQKGLVGLVNLAVKVAYDELQAVKDRLEELNDAESKHFQLLVGVAIWLGYSILEEFNYRSKVSNQIGKDKIPRGRSAHDAKRPFGFWIKSREQILETLMLMLKMNLLPIWNSNMTMVNKKVFYELILHSLSNCVKYAARDILKDNTVSDMLLELFHHFISKVGMEDQLIRDLMFNIVDTDDMARAVCKVVIGLKKDWKLPNVVRKSIARAIDVINSAEYRDQIDKGFSTFLVEIGTTFPGEIKEHSLPYVFQFVESDAVAVRNAVLAILVEIIQWQKGEIDAGRTTEDDCKQLRNKIMVHIEDFICDVNAVVRSKTVNMISKLVENNGLLIDEMMGFFNEIADRLLDSAATTRKNAFNFFTVLVNAEPILAKYTPEAFHEYALGQRRAFMQERLAHIRLDRKETIVNIYVKEFTDHISQTFLGKALCNRPLPEELKNAETAVEHIHKLVQEMKIWEACECFFRATVEFADDEVFQNFYNNHTYDVYRTYIGSELGIDLETLQEHANTELNRSAAEVLESEESEVSRRLHHHLHICETMSELMLETVIPTALLLLEKGTPADQIETLSFLGNLSVFEYPIPPSVEVQILDIVSGLSKSVVGNILEPFSLIYLKGPDSESPLGLMKILVGLCDRLGEEKRTHISFLIEEMLTAKKIHVAELKVLWDMVTLKIPNMGEHEAKIALYILYTCAKADKNSIHSLFEPLLEVTLGERGLKDMEFAHLGLLTITEFLGEGKQTTTDVKRVRLSAESALFKKISDLILHTLHPDTRRACNEHFIGVIDAGISLIYNYSFFPSGNITPIVEKSYPWLFPDTAANQMEIDSADVTYEHDMSEEVMLRLLVLGGAITGYHSNYHTHTILDEVKKRKAFRQIDAIRSTPAVKRRLRRSFVELHSRRKSGGSKQVSFADTVEDSMLKADNQELEAVVGQIGFDKEVEVLRTYTESLLEDGVISFYWRFVQHICKRYNRIQSSRVRIATIHLFGQCMLVGSKAMESGMEIFVKLWKYITHPEETVEMILMAILLNDSYPNKMERCNNLIISGLTSEHKRVRLMVLDFVVFLTQSDVLKLRDILPDTILCLADDSEDIQEVTKNFLRECQEKDTMLHSIIPDMVIRTSMNERVNREKFQLIMKNFLQPFKKVMEIAGIVDKLVDRFGNTGLTDAAAEDNSYCLSLLTYNDRSFKIITDRLPLYEKYMNNDAIFEAFVRILQNAKQNCKIENNKVKEMLKSYEKDLEAAKVKYTHGSASIEDL